jgi:transcriptional regulator with XRE-family HTH domain
VREADEDPAEEAWHIGCVIRRARHDLGLSQRAFAVAVGVSKTHLGEIERGRTDPQFTTLLRIAHGLGVSSGTLVGAWEERRYVPASLLEPPPVVEGER